MSVYSETQRELAEYTDVSPGLAALALAMAEAVDNVDNSATSRSMCAAKLIDALSKIQEAQPPKEKEDGLSELQQRRAKRIARAAEAQQLHGTGLRVIDGTGSD